MKLTLAILLCTLLGFNLEAKHEVTGSILDENNVGLAGASLVILYPSDSTMLTFGMADENGMFKLSGIHSGDYILQSSFVGYTVAYTNFSISDASLNLGEINLIPNLDVLNEVSVNANVPISFRGDTLVYSADAFDTPEGASVEDLLKRLPGIEVTKDGEIKAQGETVQKVLVNGKEFFGDDPTIATRNLESKIVEEVQVFDKSSEESEFTGVEDGEESKTINLELKEEYKSGYFGKAELQGGTKDTWKAKLNFNRFNEKTQFSTIASANNTGESAFGINDLISMAGGISNLMNGTGTIEGGLLSASSGRGIPVTASAGINLNGNFSKKLEMQNSLLLNRINNTLFQERLSTSFNGSTDFTSEANSEDKTKDSGIRLKNKWKFNPSSTSQIILNNRLGFKSNSRGLNSTTHFIENLELASSTNTNNELDASNISLDASLKYLKKLKKEGRNLVSSVTVKWTESESTNNIRNSLNLSGISNLNVQRLRENQLDRTYEFKASYTEPIKSASYFTAALGYSVSELTPIQNTFDIIDDQSIVNSLFSGNLESIQTIQSVRLSLKRTTKKHKLNLGVTPSLYTMSNSSNVFVNAKEKSKTTFLPFFNYTWKISAMKNWNFDYFTNVISPQTSDLFPVVDNSNPNTLFEGNPDLDYGYSHTISTDFRAFKSYSNRSFYVRLEQVLSKNQTVSDLNINESFIQTLTPKNSPKYNRSNFYSEYGINISKLHIYPRISLNSTLTDYIGYLNQEENEVLESRSNVKLSVSNINKTKAEIEIGYSFNYNTSDYSLNSEFNQDFFNHDTYLNFSVNLNPRIRFLSDVTQNYFSNESFSSSATYTIWNSSVSFSPAESRWKISVFAKDLLNQNIGFSRNTSLNSLIQSRYNTLGRYVGLNLVYDLKKK